MGETLVRDKQESLGGTEPRKCVSLISPLVEHNRSLPLSGRRGKQLFYLSSTEGVETWNTSAADGVFLSSQYRWFRRGFDYWELTYTPSTIESWNNKSIEKTKKQLSLNSERSHGGRRQPSNALKRTISSEVIDRRRDAPWFSIVIMMMMMIIEVSLVCLIRKRIHSDKPVRLFSRSFVITYTFMNTPLMSCLRQWVVTYLFLFFSSSALSVWNDA